MKYNEKILLALYLEMFHKYYNVCDAKEKNGQLCRHMEMQNLAILLKNLQAPYLNYAFMLDINGPKSDGLEAFLLEIDTKVETIYEYYLEYSKKKNEWYRDYPEQLDMLLKHPFSWDKIEKLSLASYLLEDIFKKENGSEALATLIHMNRTVLPYEDFSTIQEYLEKNGYSYDLDLLKEAWRIMAILGLRKMEPKRQEFPPSYLKRKIGN